MNATYINLVNRFWTENRRSQFPPSQCALYFFLLNEANALRWEMPFAMPTVVACQLTGMGKSSLARAREGLRARGLIEFSDGKFGNSSPLYSICDLPGAKPAAVQDGQSPSLGELESELAQDLPWLESVVAAASSSQAADAGAVREHLSRFFSYLRAQGAEGKGRAEAKQHFLNWLLKQLSQSKNRNSHDEDRSEHRRGPAAAEAVSVGAAAYHEPF